MELFDHPLYVGRWAVVGEDLDALAAGDFDDGGCGVFDPLALAAGDRFDPAIGPCGDAPKAVDLLPRVRPVERG